MAFRLLFLVVSLSIVSLGFGQELPQITPPSPSAFELTKYGDIQINESRGKFTHNVPLYSFNSGSLELPISFSYTGNGVKVDQLSSWTGINWILNAGGVITRIVKDKPDELGNRFLYSMEELETKAQTLNGIREINLLESSSTYDTQADYFSFSFGSYSGSFYLDKNLKPKLATYDTELQIEFLGGVQNTSNQVIIITDPNGVKYYFGGLEGTEQTRLDFTNSSSGGLLPTTAYYLYKIINPLGDEINLIYGNETGPYNIKLSNYQSVTGTRNVFNVTYNSFNGTVKNKIHNGKYLSSITSNRSNVEIHFSSTPIFNENYNRVLNEIKVVKSNPSGFEDFKKFALSYVSKNTLSNATRFFLEKIDFLNSQGIKEYDYHFEYNSYASLPDRLSYAKDYFGFYNGKNNGSELPTNNHSFLNSVPGFILADREPDFSKAVLGALSKIYYPTGGYTTIEYEAPQIKQDSYQKVNMDVYSKLSEMYPNEYPIPETKLISTFFIDEETNDMPLPSEDQQAVININAVAQGNINNKYKVNVKVENLYNPSTAQIQSFNLEYQVYSYTKTFIFNFLKNNAYKVTLELVLPPSTPNPAPVDVNLILKYSSGTEVADGIGVRVKRIKSYPIAGNTTTTRFYYQKIEDINNIDKIPNGTDLSNGYISSHKGYYIYNAGNSILDRPTSVATLKSDPVYSNFFSNGPFYKYATISYGGDFFENGGVQKEFAYLGESIGVNFSDVIYGHYGSISGEYEPISDTSLTDTQTENRDVFDGRLLSESFFRKYDKSLHLIKRTENVYTQDNSESETNLVIRRLYNRACCHFQDFLDGLHIGLYKTYTNKFNLVSQITKDFTTYVPISDLENAENYQHITTKQDYDYSNYVGLPFKTTTNTSNINQIVETLNFYPDDVSVNSSLGYDNLTSSELNAIKKIQKPSSNNPSALHQIASPIQTETIVKDLNNTILSNSVKRTNFYEPYLNKILPKNIQTLKGIYNSNTNTLEDKIQFKIYSSLGKIIEVNKTDGIPIIYIWGYNEQYPIAKIENASYDDQIYLHKANLQTLSNGNNEQNLITALNNLRAALPNAMVTTYTYKPLIGVSTITDPKGYTMYYEYDTFNRLKHVKDAQGNILTENEYKYRQ